MNDETKETNSSELLFNRAEQILNYITNLQQDNTMYAQLKDEYEEEIKDLQQRIDKAIEYLRDNTDRDDYLFLIPSEVSVLSSILKGDSDE